MANPTFKITMENGGIIEGELYPETAPQSAPAVKKPLRRQMPSPISSMSSYQQSKDDKKE